MKISLITALVLLPAVAFGATPSPVGSQADQQEQLNQLESTAVEPETELEEIETESANWVDASHAYATDKAQELTLWMDSFFGDPNYDLETPESLVRVEWVNAWDEEEDYRTRVRLRGKVYLPQLSRRLNLVFSGEDGDSLRDEERDSEDDVGILYNIDERKRSRVDLTLAAGGGDLKPGIRYRNQGPIGEKSAYRYTQRLQWKDSEGFFTTGQLNLDQGLSENRLLRWSNAAVYGEETAGTEWRTQLSLRQRFEPIDGKHKLVMSYFGSVNGYTDPSYVKNYRLGVLFRRQVYRRFFFIELEPSYNFRKKLDQNRNRAWHIVMRFEVALESNWRRNRGNDAN